MSRRDRVPLRDGVILRLLREAERQQLTNGQLADRTGLSDRAVRRLWRGEASWQVADRVSAALGISWDLQGTPNT